MNCRALFAALSIVLSSLPAIGASSPGLVAQWTTNARHATKLGHIDWENWDETSVVDDVNFARTRGAFYPGGPTDYFAVRLVGQVDVPTDGSWAFTVESDQGVQLLINGEMVVDDPNSHSYRTRTGTIPLTAGKHDIEVRYWEGWSDAGLVLSWSGPSTPLATIPAGAFSHTGEEAAFDPGGDGLWAYWYRNLRHTSSVGQVDWSAPDRVATQQRIAFPITGGSFVAGESSDYFGAKFVGIIDVPEAGEWTFELGSDQSAELLIDGQPVVIDQAGHSFRWRTGKINLSEGDHTIEVRFWEGWSTAALFVAWQGPSDSHPSIIPSSAYRPGSGATNPPTGEGLTAYWYDNARHASGVGQVDWTQHDRIGSVQKVYWPITSRGFDAGGPTDYFATRLAGYIDVPESGQWTFKLGSDQSARVFIDGKLVINDSAGHSMRWRTGAVNLSAGKHTIEVQHWEGWSTACLVLTWTPPGSDREEVIPASAFSPRKIDDSVAAGNGLRVYWVDNARHAQNVGHINFANYDDVTIVPNLSWGVTSDPFEEGQNKDYVGLRAVGRITLPESGVWKFGMGSDQSARLYVNGELVVDDSGGHSYRWRNGSIELDAGTYDFEVRHWEGWSSGGLVVTWTAPSGSEEVIPPSALTYRSEDPPLDQGGGGLRAYWTTNARHAQNVGQIDWDNNDLVTTVENVAYRISADPFDDEVPGDYVAMRVLGQIEIPSDGTWTFNLGSDQSATLYIDGEPVVEDATGHSYRWRSGKVVLTAGWHDIELRHWEGWSTSGLHLAWSGPGVPEQLVPRTAFRMHETESPYEPGGGIRAYWTTNGRHAQQAGHIDHAEYDQTTVVERLSFSRRTSAFYQDGPTDYFGARFLAKLNVPESGLWTFGLGSDQSAVLLINGQAVVADPTSHSYRWRRGAVNLDAGEHMIEVLYWDGWSEQGLHVTWQAPDSNVEEIIPASAFDLYEGDPAADCATQGLRAEWLNTTRSQTLATIDWDSETPDAITKESRVSWKRSRDSFAPGINPDYFAVRITGTLDVPYDGEWTFGLGSDQYGALRINNSTVISDLGSHSFRWRTGTARLSAGKHSFEVLMQDGWSEQGLFVSWMGPADTYERIIPACAFGETDRVRVVRWREVSSVDETSE